MRNDDIYQAGVLVERIADNEDGTGTRTTYDGAGNVTSSTALTGLPIPAVPELTDAERLGILLTSLADAVSMADVVAAAQEAQA